MGAVNRILIPTDFTPCADRAVPVILDYMARHVIDLTVLGTHRLTGLSPVFITKPFGKSLLAFPGEVAVETSEPADAQAVPH